MTRIANLLLPGDRRSIGKVPLVVKLVLANSPRLEELLALIGDYPPPVRMRAADAIEKISNVKPELLQPYKRLVLLKLLSEKQSEVKWHLAQIVPRLLLEKRDRERAVSAILHWLDDKSESKIVRVMALQALALFAQEDFKLKTQIRRRLKSFVRSGPPSLRSRSQKLLQLIDQA